jgi:HD-like signal output (HDOD) protein
MTTFWGRRFGATKPEPPTARPGAVRSTAPTPDPQPPVAAACAFNCSPAEISESFHRLLFALPAAAEGTPTSSGRAMLKRLELLSTRFDVRSLPRLPAVLPQLLRTLRNDTAAGAELAKLVGRDPLMVGEVMRVTSSVHYRTAQPIGSLRQAVILLGQEGLHRVVTQLAMMPILQASTGNSTHAGELLWEHAERCAHACAWLSKSDGGDTFEAYLAGVVSHTGTGAVVRLLRQLLADASTQALDSRFIMECAALGTRLSLQAACYWELPERVIAALDENQQAPTGTDSKLGDALRVADALAMTQVLVGHDVLPAEVDLGPAWPGRHTPAQIKHCQDNLRQHFAAEVAAPI